jgi:transcriptional regulator with XRE-family HTH domain
MSGQPAGQVQSFDQALKALMRERRVGVDKLAFATGISPRLIGKYRSGTVVPRDPFGDPSENAVKIARELGVDVAVLLPPLDEEEAA